MKIAVWFTYGYLQTDARSFDCYFITTILEVKLRELPPTRSR